MLPAGTRLQDRYVIVRQLGQGGMGAVYLATDARFGSPVALKQTTVEGDVLLKAFEREARLLNSLRHAALPVVMDYFSEAAGHFLVMQFIPGEDLAHMLGRNGGPFDIATALQWADQLLSALDYLHTRTPPVIHRDIKPQNLKLTPEGHVILLDFGLAKGAASHMTQTNKSVAGYTPHYASPEQMRGLGTDATSDLYALAATLYHLATGRLPVDALSRAVAMLDGGPDPLPLASDVNAGVPRPVAEVLHRALRLTRDERFPSAVAMRDALRSATEAYRNPPVAPPPPTVGVAQPAARWHGAGAWLSLVGCLGVAGILVAVLFAAGLLSGIHEAAVHDEPSTSAAPASEPASPPASESPAPLDRDQLDRVENRYLAGVAKVLKGDEVTKDRVVKFGDIDGDGDQDAVVQFSLQPTEGGNHGAICLAVFINTDGKFAGVTDALVGSDYQVFELKTVQEGNIIGARVECKDESFPPCDPGQEVRRDIAIRYFNNKLTVPDMP